MEQSNNAIIFIQIHTHTHIIAETILNLPLCGRNPIGNFTGSDLFGWHKILLHRCCGDNTNVKLYLQTGQIPSATIDQFN